MSDWNDTGYAEDTYYIGEDLSGSWEVGLTFSTDPLNPDISIYDENSDHDEYETIDISLTDLRRIIKIVEEGVEKFGESKVLELKKCQEIQGTKVQRQFIVGDIPALRKAVEEGTEKGEELERIMTTLINYDRKKKFEQKCRDHNIAMTRKMIEKEFPLER